MRSVSVVVFSLSCSLLIPPSNGNDDTTPLVAWNVNWWESKATMSTNSGDDLSTFDRGVSLSIDYPSDGQLVRYFQGWGDITPKISMFLEEGELAQEIRNNVSAWSICTSIDEKFHDCIPLLQAANGIPRMDVDTRKGEHILRAWLGNSASGRGEQNPGSSSVASRFSTHNSLLGTGCRSAANWFLVSSQKGIGNKLMKRWYTKMKERWEDLLDNDMYKSGSGLQLWRYFEMDCSLTDLRRHNQIFDELIMGLAPFPVGNSGDPNTPHECLSRDVDFSDYEEPNSSWMLKLKEDLTNIDEYHAYLDRQQSSAPNTQKMNELTVEIPRVIWMFWYQNEKDPSLKPRDRACIEGWRRLNPTWEVKLLDVNTGKIHTFKHR